MLGLLHPLLLSDVVLFVFSSYRISHLEEEDDEAFFVSSSVHYCWVNKCNCSDEGFSADYPGTSHLLTKCIPSAPALLVLAISRFSAPWRVNKSGAAMSTFLSVWMDNSVGSPSDPVSDLLFHRARLAPEEIQVKQ
jgi:hypothetical protein